MVARRPPAAGDAASRQRTPGRRVPELDRLEPAVRALGCRFVTTDVALRADGTWRVVEVGDGQVSDLHPAIDPAELAALLTAA